MSCAFALDAWKNFSRSDTFYSAALVDNVLVLGTDGGVRIVLNDGTSTVLASASGLESADIRAVVRSQDGELFAVSADGIISKLLENNRFLVLNRSFAESSSELVPGLVEASGKILVLGFRNRIAFFDVEKGKSVVSLSRVGSVSLKTTSPSAMLVSGDSLFVALGSDVYVREMSWDALDSDILLADPSSWTLAGTFHGDSSATSIRRLSVSSKTLHADFAQTLSPIVACGDTLKAKRFPELWKDDSSRVSKILEGDGFAYLVGENSAWYYDGELSDVSAWTGFQMESPYVALPYLVGEGGVTVYSSKGDFGWSDGETFLYAQSMGDLPYYAGTEGYDRRLKNLETLSDGMTLVSIWGFGFRLYAEYGGELVGSVGLEESNCAERYLTNYIVPTGVTAAPDSSGWLVSFWGSSAYGLGYIDKAGNISCANGSGSGKYSGPLKAKWSDDGSEWILYSGAGKTSGVDGSGALDVFRIRPVSETGGELSIIEKETVPTPDNYVAIDMDFDSDGRLWVVTNIAFGYLESGMDSVQAPHKTSSFEQASLSSISVDAKNRLWIGTVGKGAFMVKKTGASPDTMAATKFVKRNGLLDDAVYDVAVDGKKGEVWFVHRKGVSRYARTDLRETSSYMTSEGPKFKAYPNPVRFDRGETFTFEHISESAVVSIYNSGAHLVRSFEGDELLGGRLVWDGRDKRGVLVAPGVYHYIVKKGSRKKQGKILVIH